MIGINLLVDLALPNLLINTNTDASGNASIPMGIPAQPGLGNATLYAQWIVQDAGASQGLSASRGSKITICP